MLPFSPSIDLTDQLVHHLFQLLVLTHVCSARDRHLPCNSSYVPHTLSRNSVNTFPRKYSFQKLSQHFIKKILFWGTRSTLNQENTLSRHSVNTFPSKSLFQNTWSSITLSRNSGKSERRRSKARNLWWITLLHFLVFIIIFFLIIVDLKSGVLENLLTKPLV